MSDPGIEISTLHVLYNIVHINRIINLLLASLKGTCGKGAPLCLSQNSSALFNSYSYKTRKLSIIQRIMILSTVCTGSSDPAEKIFSIFASENKDYTILKLLRYFRLNITRTQSKIILGHINLIG